jgi:hypothetical protein
LIREQDLLDAIAECQGERNPNANTCMKLAAYYTILNNIRGVSDNNVGNIPTYSYSDEPTEIVRYSSGSEFSRITDGLSSDDVMAVMDELMDTLQILAPKLYNATLEKLKSF